MKAIKYCDCGHYKPKSLRGIIDTSCRNCGGKKRHKKFGPINFGR